ncbi:MAG: four helix bundle protein [Gemmataceae bacterium]|nr:four helix bundle protein [Gemmataceae bacterium]
MPYEPIENRRVYQRAEAVGDRIWELVIGWDWFLKQTIGGQLTRAADSIGANIAEAGGRFHPGEVRKFLYYSRGSLRETVYWLRRCLARQLITQIELDSLIEEVEQLSREINQSIKFQNNRKGPE